MRSITKPITVKLTELEKLAVDQLVAQGKYLSVSEAIRAGLMLLAEKHMLKPETVRNMERGRRINRPRKGKVRRLKPDVDL